MSILSAQIDNLRLMARLVREYDYTEISRMLREAADTIEGLRERLQAYALRGECENLWEEFGKFKCSVCLTEVASMSTNTTAPLPLRFCPVCGAKIRKAVER